MSNIEGFDDLESNVCFKPDFSFTKTLGTFVINEEFSKGYVEFLNNKETANSYTWICLSAIGDYLGDILHKNVVNYVDYVSNIDVCKIDSLKSMMKMFGFQYTIFDNINYIPLELYNLINIFSVNKKYLFNNKIFKDSYLDIAKSKFISQLSSPEDLKSKYFSEKSDIEFDTNVINERDFFNYISGCYDYVIRNFIELEYNVDGNVDKSIWKNLLDGNSLDPCDFTDDEFRQLKTEYDIPLDFDYSSVVDDIENGYDSLDNYSHPYTIILNKEIERRQNTVTSEQISSFSNVKNLNCSKYSYYREKKVQEYVDFVNNKYFLNAIELSSDSILKYVLDENYLDLTQTSYSIEQNVISNSGINYDMIAVVARSLTIATLYIQKLREKLKIQTRKNYMKGTQNLLLYVINEYLVDYSRHKLINMIYSGADSSSEEYKFLVNTLGNLSSHDIDNIDLIEYYDQTEYFNQRTETSYESNFGNLVNEDFWEQTDMQNDNGFAYDLKEIQKFYINTMSMCDTISSSENLSEFLQLIFGIGADKSYINAETGIFHTDLEKYKDNTENIYPRYSSMLSALNYLKKMLTTEGYPSISSTIVDYEEIEDIVLSDQIQNCSDNYVYPNISSDTFSNISAVYNKYNNDATELSLRLASIQNSYDSSINSIGRIYLLSSDALYCKDDIGFYKHDYYVDNKYHYPTTNYLIDKIESLLEYMATEEDVANYELLDTFEETEDILKEVSSEFCEELSPAIKSSFSSYEQISSTDNIKEILKDTLDFLYGLCDDDLDGLSGSLDQLKNDVQQLSIDYQEFSDKVDEIESEIANDDFFKQNSFVYDLSSGGGRYFGTLYNVTAVVAGSLTHRSDAVKAKSLYQISSSIPDNGIYFYNIDNNKYYVIPNTQDAADDELYDGQLVFGGETSDGSWNGDTYISQTVMGESYSHITGQFKHSMTPEERIEWLWYFANRCPTSINVQYVLSDIRRYNFGLNSKYGANLDEYYTAKDDILSEINRIVNQLISLGYDYDYEQYQDEDLKTQIFYLQRFVNSLNYVVQEYGSSTSEVYEYINWTIELSNQFDTASNECYRILENSWQQNYLSDFEYPTNYISWEFISKIKEYISEKDPEICSNIIEQFNNLWQEINVLNVDDRNLAEQMNLDLTYPIDINDIPDVDILNMINALDEDIISRSDDAEYQLYVRQKEYNDYINIITPELSDYLDGENGIIDSLKKRVGYLNFFNTKEYQNRYKMFRMYTGLSDSYYPYYNIENKTHPSYQIHPFLWNFVEKSSSCNITQINKSFTGSNIDDLENENVQESLKSYYGEFGQSINIWKNNAIDYNGYTTRYEQSNHYNDSNSITSEVIDYDGLFYPPALERLMLDGKDIASTTISSAFTLNSAINKIVNFLSGQEFDSLYEISCQTFSILSDYYNSTLLSNSISSSLVNYGSILDFIETDFIQSLSANLGETFYGLYYSHLDIQNNDNYREYIATQIQEQFNTIRNIGRGSNYDIYKYGIDQNNNIYVLLKTYANNTDYISKRNTSGTMWIRLKDHPIAFLALDVKHPNIYIYDSSKTIHPAIQKSEKDKFTIYDFEISKDRSFLYLIENTHESNSPITLSYGENSYIGILQLNTVNENGLVTFYKDTETATKTTDIVYCDDNYKFIGMYYPKSNETDFVYYNNSGDVVIKRIIDGLEYSDLEISGNISLDKNYSMLSDQVEFAYDYTDGELTFAYLVNYDECVISVSNGTTIDISSANLYDQKPTSFDFNTQNIRLVKCYIEDNSLIVDKDRSSLRNINADMSYIPVYPGLSAQANIANIQNDGILRVELLGMENDIDDSISNTVENVDPYFDIDSISSLYTYGRVYEDVDFSKDVTFRTFVNPPLIPTLNKNYISVDDNSLYWYIKDMQNVKYQDDIISGVQFIVYNTKTLGKNAYINSKICLVSSDWVNVDNYMSVESSFENKISVTLDDNNEQYVNTTGTYNGVNETNSLDNNHIDNISNISIKYDINEKCLIMRFDYQDKNKVDTTFISRGDIRIILYTKEGLDIFNYYHYIDPYGTGYTKSALSSIDTSKYSNLSNIEELSGYDRLSFKYDEESIFDYGNLNYYFPTLNNVYPKTIGLAFQENNTINTSLQTSKNIFGQNNLFVINCFDTNSILSNIGEVTIQVQAEEVGVPRLYCDGTDLCDGTIISNSQIYDGEDIRSLVNKKIIFEDESISNILSSSQDWILQESNTQELIPLYEISSNCWGSLDGVYKLYYGYDDSYKNKFSFEYGGLMVEKTTEYEDPNSLSLEFSDSENEYLLTRTYSLFDKYISSDNLIDDCFDKLYEDKLSTYIRYTCQSYNDNSTEKVRFKVGLFNADLEKYMRLFVNYKNSDDGIHLYFNYTNYIDSPFIKIENNKIYPSLINGTYLHLKPNESGSLKFVTQFKYYVDDEIVGIKDLTLATVSLYNVSDDKPKFIIKNKNYIQENDGSDYKNHPSVQITIRNGQISLGQTRVAIGFDINSDNYLSDNYTFNVSYPEEVVSIQNSNSQDYSITSCDFGLAKITIKDPDLTHGFMVFRAKNYNVISALADIYQIQCDETTNIYGQNGYSAVVTTNDGYLSVYQ